jgi:hypothetical protein
VVFIARGPHLQAIRTTGLRRDRDPGARRPSVLQPCTPRRRSTAGPATYCAATTLPELCTYRP